MSQTFIAIFINLAMIALPKLGVSIGSDALTTTVTTLVAIGSGVWVLLRRHQAGGVNVIGLRK